MPRIPVYSDGMGQVALPTRRLNKMSGADIQAMAAPGEALARVGEQLAQTGQNIFNTQLKIEEKRQRDDARIWVLNNRAKLTEESSIYGEELKKDIDSSIYEKDPTADGKVSPDSYTSRYRTWFDEKLGTYTPPNKIAEQMWREETITMRSRLVQKGIEYEANERLLAIGRQLDSSLATMAGSVQMDPGTVHTQIAAWDYYLDTTDDPKTGTREGVGGTLAPGSLEKLRMQGKASIAKSGLVGLIQEDPLTALKIIDNRSWDKGNMYGLDPDSLSTLRDKAFRAASTINEANLAELSSRADEHIASLSQGGDGLREFSSIDSAMQQFYRAFGGEDVVNYFPTNRNRLDVMFREFESNVRVARASGIVVTKLSYAPVSDLLSFQRKAQDIGKGGAITPADVASLGAAYNIGPDTFAGLSTSEQLKVIAQVSGTLNAQMKQRADDPSLYLEGHDAVQAVRSDPNAGFEDVAKIKNAIYEQIEQPPGQRLLLTDTEAGGLVASLKDATRNPDAVTAQMANLENEYGRYWPQVWQQLTTMKGGLGSEWVMLGSLASTSGVRLYAQAMQTDPKQLKEMFATEQTLGTTYAQVQSATRNAFNDTMMSLTGGLPGRVNETAPLMEQLIKATALITLQGGDGSTVQEAAQKAVDIILNGIDVINEEKMKAFVTPEIVTSTGSSVTGTYFTENAEKFLNSRQSFDRTLAILHDKQLVIPGSLDPVIQGDYSLRRNSYLDAIVETGYFVMSDNADGLMLVMPQLGGMVLPVMAYKTGSDTDMEPVVFPFEAFNNPVDTNPYNPDATP